MFLIHGILSLVDIMKSKRINFQSFLFWGVVVVAALVAGIFSYNRFLIKNDYMVGYEGECDPSFESCFVGCEDDECTQEYYYTEVQKYAPDLYKECGKDITDCDAANICLPEDNNCSVTYCNPETANEDEACSDLINTDILDEDSEKNIDEENVLEDNIINENI